MYIITYLPLKESGQTFSVYEIKILLHTFKHFYELFLN